MSRNDAWCVHSVAHVHEMKGEVDKGLKFLETTETDWQVSRSCKSTGAMLDTVDACSLLYRLQMEGPMELPRVTLRHTDDHVAVLNDVPFLTASPGAAQRLSAPAAGAPRRGPASCAPPSFPFTAAPPFT
ncbi:unnamed protein product [Merluccius merluccius]